MTIQNVAISPLARPKFDYFFGLNSTNSNRNFPNQTNDQINTSFPVALLFRMEELGFNPSYLSVVDGKFSLGEIPISEILGADSSKSYFDFEGECTDQNILQYTKSLPRADLFVSTILNRGRAFEVKMVVVPDTTTKKRKSHNLFAPELVIRPDTIAYLAAFLCAANFEMIKKKIKACGVSLKANDCSDAKAKLPEIIKCIYAIADELGDKQSPFLYMPIWKTEATPPYNPEKHCFDAFFYSDAAFTKLVADVATPKPVKINLETKAKSKKAKKQTIGRNERTAIWLYLSLKQAVEHGRFDHKTIHAENSYSEKNDKAFAANGVKMLRYVTCAHMTTPRVEFADIDLMMTLAAIQTKRIFADTLLQHFPK
jgi:hypothetical protein